jgi:transcriptional regulator with XRE-family HTH domain
MKPEPGRSTFGEALFKARKKAKKSLQAVAAEVFKEDGEPISHQYLSDLEKGRRNPPSDQMIEQLAKALNVSRNYLFYCAGRIPADFILPVDEVKAEAVFRAISKELGTLAAA